MAFWTPLRRIMKSGWQHFIRDKSASSSSLVVLVIMLLLVSSVLFLKGFSDFLVSGLQNRIDISTYFTDAATEEEILELRDELRNLSEVREVQYVSKQEALERFLEERQDDEVVVRSLEVLGDNPLLASLSIKAWEPSSFARISIFLEESQYASLIENVDYRDRAVAIERIATIIQGVRWGIIGASIFTAIIAILVTFNTVRLTIYNSREEIEVMRLVGASNWFIRGPFIVQGIIAGLFAVFIAMLVLIPIVLLFSPQLQQLEGEFSLWNYFMDNIAWVLLAQIGVAIGIGVLSSMFAIRRYLRV